MAFRFYVLFKVNRLVIEISFSELVFVRCFVTALYLQSKFAQQKIFTDPALKYFLF